MAEAPNVPEVLTKHQGLQFKTTLEVVAIYFAAFITFLTFFDYLNVALYSMLGFVSLLAFFTIIFAMVGYIIYNFYVFFKTVLA
ncbi:MAG: hypothetical protein HeimC3_30920 [Candidatus Heimdallarchaeota archaeon LC_3]|nr:MAG: hypothetical protein HeimC3_30920 [Candidatus Heimdallarchaeota archaeon LC_3]